MYRLGKDGEIEWDTWIMWTTPARSPVKRMCVGHCVVLWVGSLFSQTTRFNIPCGHLHMPSVIIRVLVNELVLHEHFVCPELHSYLIGRQSKVIMHASRTQK